jgi:hypothetical protein
VEAPEKNHQVVEVRLILKNAKAQKAKTQASREDKKRAKGTDGKRKQEKASADDKCRHKIAPRFFVGHDPVHGKKGSNESADDQRPMNAGKFAKHRMNIPANSIESSPN